MNIKEITFSPTGGTQAVSDIIVSSLGDNIVSKFDLTDYKTDFKNINFSNEDVVVISVPSYGGRVPNLAIERLKCIQGNGAKCIIVCVYGNRAYEDTLVELYDTMVECNFRVIAAISAVADHSIIHEYAANRPDEFDKNELTGFAKAILDKINTKDVEILPKSKIPGDRPYKQTGKFKMVPKPDKKCVKCGLCAKLCPNQAIDYTTLIADPNKCISCMRCVAKCPKSARNLNVIMLKLIALLIKKACLIRKNNELFI